VGVSVRSEFVCGAERSRAEAMAAHLGLRLCHRPEGETGGKVLLREISALADAALRANPPERCYLCKRHVMAEVRQAALEHFGPGAVIAEGTNADDDPARPGRRAVAEYGARSPLAECGITKAEVRELARLAGLPNADDPSNSCLATRVPTGYELTHSRLTAIEGLERVAREMGLADLRARLLPSAPGQADAVRLEVRPAQRLLAESCLQALCDRAEFLGFSHFTLGERS
jgi:ATP-utilizing enzymes of the PP-loop superfamily